MNEERIMESPSWSDPRGQLMKTPDDVGEMLRLKASGWGYVVRFATLRRQSAVRTHHRRARSLQHAGRRNE